jgi:hypothetical protein
MVSQNLFSKATFSLFLGGIQQAVLHAKVHNMQGEGSECLPDSLR